MQQPDLHLPEVNFTAPPTKSQIVNTLRDIAKFLGQLGGSILHDASYTLGGEDVGALLNATIHVRAAGDKFEAGPNSAGLAVPQQMPGGPQRVR